MTLIRLVDVSKTYPMGGGGIQALVNIKLSVDPGEFVAVWGPSGSGKSTLCNLMGLLDQPSQGELYFKDQMVSRIPDDDLSRLRNESIGFIFQNFNLLPVLSALENVMFPLEIRGEKPVKARAKAQKLLEQMEMGSLSSHRPARLSGGQQQRVAIARALVNDPGLVIADEPTANLDSQTSKSIIDLMRTINRDTGTTFIFSTHDQRLLEQVERKVLLKDGSISSDVRMKDCNTQPRVSPGGGLP